MSSEYFNAIQKESQKPNYSWNQNLFIVGKYEEFISGTYIIPILKNL